MNSFDALALSEPLESLADVSTRTWALLGLWQLDGGSCYIVDITDCSKPVIRGYYSGPTGDVFECPACDANEALPAPDVSGEPAVHVIGSLDGQTGQVTVRQPQGNYLRICRWDRIQSDMPAMQGALLRTLPQCGCGGSLGTPKLFGSFAEMSAYHFGAFYLA